MAAEAPKFEGAGDEKIGVKGYPLENSSVLYHLCTAYGELLLFFLFLSFSLFFSLFFSSVLEF